MKKFLFCLIVLIYATNELEALTCKQIQAFVDGHNSRRLKLAKGEVKGQPPASDMKFMIWDNELEAKASQWAAQNQPFHNPDKTIPSGRFTTGENLYWYSVTNRNYKLNPDQALESWFNEHMNFTYQPLRNNHFSNRNGYQIGHYTQMVWSETMFVGCAMSETYKNKWKKFFVVCNYGPAGNYISEYPYKAGRSNPNLICDCKKYDKNCDCNKPYGRDCKNV